jgi:hypothetical protein
MRLRAAIAMLALAVPVFAQHGGGHAGSSGGHGFAGHSGFSGGAGISRSGNFSRPAEPMRYGAPGNTGFRAIAPPNYASRGIPVGGNRYTTARPASRPAYDSMGADARGGNRAGDRGRFDARRRSFNNWYTNYYPAWPWYGYPYLIDPGFYDWSVPDDSPEDSNDQAAAPTENEAPYPDYGYGGPEEGPEPGYAGELPPWVPSGQPYGAAPSAVASEPVPEEPLTVIFKSGRAPVKMQNYMMTAKMLTDLDSRHYEQIPFDEIDVAATQRANAAAGIQFQVPTASRD